MKISTLVRAIALSAFVSSSAFALDAADDPKTKPTPMATTAPTPADAAAKAAKSAECSKEADAKGLTGKERKKFRSACRRGK